MMNLRNQSVNVDRVELICVLRAGLEVHRAEYAEARAEYEAAVVVFMTEALERAKSGNFRDLVLRLSAPVNHAQEYIDVIEMLEVSVDETIQLDKDSFRAFYRNEWSWSSGFAESMASYKTTLSSGPAAALGAPLKPS